MQTVIEFLNELASRGVKLSANAGQLSCYAQKGALTSELRDGIVRFKPELIALLERMEQTSAAPREFPLSVGQKGLYVLQKLHPEMSAYNVPLCFRINADIDANVMAKAWDRVLDQFPILTARIVERNGSLVQRLDGDCRTTLHQRSVDFADDEQLASFLRQHVKQPFDLHRGPLARAALFMRAGQKSILLLTVHHIVFDGASAVIALKSLLDFYLQISEGKPFHASQAMCGYGEFVAWEEAMLASAEGAAHARYWQQQLDGEPPAVELPPDVEPRPVSASFEGETLVQALPEDLCTWVRDFSKANAMPPSVIFLAMFHLLLHRYTNEDDVIVGMPVMGRAAQQFAMEVGYFINMVPLRARFGEPARLLSFLRKTQGAMLDALYHSSYPFPLMIEAANQTRRRDKSPIFRISYAYQNFVTPADFMSLLQQQTFQLETVAGIWQEGDFDLGLEIYEGEGSSFSVHLKYKPDLYTRNRIDGVFEHYCALLRAVSVNPNRFTHEYPILTEREARKLLVELNHTRTDLPPQNRVHDLFAEQAALHPEKVAAVCGDERLTYRELHERSRGLAWHLQSMGAGPDRPVGLYMRRSLDLVIAQLGTLQASAAYVVLDPDDPEERRAQILRDCGAVFVLTEERLREMELVERGPLRQVARADDLACVVYIPGPKGVEITHRAVVNRLLSMRRKPGMTERDVVLAMTADLYLPLCVGAQIVIAPDGATLPATLRSSGATIVQAALATWRQLFDAGWDANPKLMVLCDGEPLSRELANRLLETGCPVWSLYGAEETGLASVARVEAGRGPVLLGSPVDNTQLYVLDRHGVPQLPGVTGELYIAGDGLALGYRNQPELTGERFVDNPFTPGRRMYRTGDRACWWEDGSIELLETRLQTGPEIEAHLNEHPAVEECAVIAHGRSRRLIAFYRANVAVSTDEVRGHLSRTLPLRMMPAVLVSVAGTIDRGALAELFLEQQRAWWQRTLAGVPALDLVTDVPREDARRFVAAAHDFVLSAELTQRLKQIAERRGGTLFMVLVAAFKVLLHRYTGQRDICIGTMSSETLPLRSHVDPEDTFSSFLTQLKTTFLEAHENQDAAVSHVFQAIVVSQRGWSECEITAVFNETPDGVAASFEYNAALYGPRTIDRMADHFAALCRAIAAKPAAKIRSLEFLGAAEEQQVLVRFNETDTAHPGDKCLHQLFVEQARLHEDRTAVICGERSLSYQALHDQSADLALALQVAGVAPETIVALCLERSFEMIVGVLGTMQAGGAYLPLDPSEPEERLAYMLQDSQAPIVLTQDKFKYKLASLLAPDAKLIQWSDIARSAASLEAKRVVLRQDVQPGNASHVLYTGGSTGKPRGVVVEHRALVNRLQWMQRRFPLDPNDIVLQKTPYVSDGSIWELLWPLTVGASFVFAAPEWHEDVAHLERLVDAAAVTTLRSFPGEGRTVFSSVKRIFCNGEAVERARFPNASIHRLYAPVEGAGDVAAYDCMRSDGTAIPIGTPVDNTRIYILDQHNRPQPIGVPGEMYIAGAGLARGYLNRPKLTRETFVANPFTPGTRMYRTGEMGRWLDDGNIQHLGCKR